MTLNETIDTLVAQVETLIEAHNDFQNNLATNVALSGLGNAQASLVFGATKEYGVLTRYRIALLSLKTTEAPAVPPVGEI